MTDNFSKFLRKMGGMHDSKVLEISWVPVDKMLKLRIEDIYTNFFGFPEYPGATYGELIFKGVSYLEMDFDSNQLSGIYDFEVSEEENPLTTITFWPQGKINLRFSEVTYPEIVF